jgi:two-component sensor histidine kinase
MKKFKDNNWILISISSLILISVLYFSNELVKDFKNEEKKKMELWSEATKELANSDVGEISPIILNILENNKITPMLVIDNISNKVIDFKNIKDLDVNDYKKINELTNKFKSENVPIIINYSENELSTLYYGNSSLLNKIKFYPIILLTVIIIFGSFVYFLLRSAKISEINFLWSGMAKEAAHQIGTPLTSIMGWLELIKNTSNKKKYLSEIEKDLERLNIISERFNKIGSKPKLKKENICSEINKTINYLRDRLSKKISLEFDNSNSEIYTNLNSQLFSWSLENIIKNSIDSIKENGSVRVSLAKSNGLVRIYISDNGMGIKKDLKNKIFQPGITTKERGWGLGLSLTKRIIEEYHNGEIKIENSAIGKGTTMLIKLKAIK